MAEPAEEPNEAELMRTCGHLYVSIALESFATTLMCCAFAYLLLLITSKGRLDKPGTAAYIFVKHQVVGMYSELASEVRHWAEMAKLPLERRFALCRKCNQAICMFALAIGVLTVERWLHINNVNGFRYLGYAVTCPPMQTELLILIAPVIPCYRLQCITTFLVTMLMLLFGYGASVIPGPLYEGSLKAFISSGGVEDLKPNRKLYLTTGAITVQFYLSFIQIPYLALMYLCKRRSKEGKRLKLPEGYLRLLLIVATTWLAFPAWWLVSFEGMSLMTDTKMSASIFAFLNVFSKGCFTLQMLSMVKRHRVQKKREEAVLAGRRPSLECQPVGLFEPHEEEADQEIPASSPSDRKLRRTETWLVRVLRPYDEAHSPPSLWGELDATVQAFLVGNGVTPKTWHQMSLIQRKHMMHSYESSVHLVDCTEAQEGAQEAREGAQEVLRELARDGAQAQAQEEDCTSSSFSTTRPGIHKGQMLTSQRGQRGRVLEILDNEVQLAVLGKGPIFVSIDDLTVVKVRFLGARGLQAVDSTGKLRLYCSCMVWGKPSSEVQTKAKVQGGQKVSWEDEVRLYGFSFGDALAIRLWGKDPTARSDDLLGEAKLQTADFRGGAYEGELQLQDGPVKIHAHLSVLVTTENLPQEVDAESDDGAHRQGEAVAHLQSEEEAGIGTANVVETALYPEQPQLPLCGGPLPSLFICCQGQDLPPANNA